MPAQINVKVSPALDPETVLSLDGYSETTAQVVSPVYSAFNDAYITLGKIHEAAALWADNPAVTPENAILIVSKEAAVQQNRLLKRMDTLSRTLEASIAHTEAELTAPLAARAMGTLNAEVRAHAKSLSREDRAKLIREAMDAGDEATLASVLGSPPFLSGLSAEDHAHYVHTYHSEKNPGLVDRLRVMRAALEKVDRDGRLIIKEMRKAVRADVKEVKAIDTANQRALDALKIEPTN